MKSLKYLLPSNWNIKLNENLYNAEINRKNPTAILIMIDQSGSMGFNTHFYEGEEQTYAEIVSKMVNEMLNEVIGRCTKSEGVRDYFNVCVLGYGGKSNTEANILWEDGLRNKDWVSISELKENANYEKRTVVKTIRGKNKVSEIEVPYWFKPVAKHQTPMGDAFNKSHQLLIDWIKAHKNSYPPVVINITDGAQTDYSDDALIETAQKLQALNTTDGNVLVLNIHISGGSNAVIFPLTDIELPNNEYSKRLYEMSSVMPETYNVDISNIRNDKDAFSNYRGMAFNVSMDNLFNLIDIGTSGATKQLNNGVG